MLFLPVREKQSTRNLRIKSTRTANHKLFWLNAYNSHNNPYLPPDISKFAATTYKSHFQPFASLPFYFLPTEEVAGAETVLVPRIEKTYYSRRVYTYDRNSVFQTPVINSWSGLGKKQGQVSAGFNIFPNRFQKEIGLKIESDLGINSVPAIKGKPGIVSTVKLLSNYLLGVFLRNGFFLFFCTMVNNWNI